jgi:serine kinase of HPr protein (carbohydrate metabolism regulator)
MALLEQASAGQPAKLATDEPQTPLQPHPLEQCPNALIGDDRLVLRGQGRALKASPAGGLEGLIEVRGLGILSVPWCTDAPLHLVIDLVSLTDMERLPEVGVTLLAGHSLCRLAAPVGDLAHQLLLVQLALRTMVRED